MCYVVTTVQTNDELSLPGGDSLMLLAICDLGVTV